MQLTTRRGRLTRGERDRESAIFRDFGSCGGRRPVGDWPSEARVGVLRTLCLGADRRVVLDRRLALERLSQPAIERSGRLPVRERGSRRRGSRTFGLGSLKTVDRALIALCEDETSPTGPLASTRHVMDSTPRGAPVVPARQFAALRRSRDRQGRDRGRTRGGRLPLR